MSGGKGGGGGGSGGGKGKLGAIGEEGGKRRVLAVSFDFSFFVSFYLLSRSFYLLSFLVPVLLLLLSSILFFFFFTSSSHSKDKTKLPILSLTTLPTDH